MFLNNNNRNTSYLFFETRCSVLVLIFDLESMKSVSFILFFIGCLLNFLRKNRDIVLRKRSIMLEMVIHVASAMAYLEKKNFIHRDLVRRILYIIFMR